MYYLNHLIVNWIKVILHTFVKINRLYSETFYKIYLNKIPIIFNIYIKKNDWNMKEEWLN